MKATNIKVSLRDGYLVKDDGTFDFSKFKIVSGQNAGMCYMKDNFNSLLREQENKSLRRADMTLNNMHHSVFEHEKVTLVIENIPKILAMVLNNEKSYVTSEKSGRYTEVKPLEGSLLTNREYELYKKWLHIFMDKIKEVYKDQFDDKKITKLAQENARNMVSVFMPTSMIHTISIRQLNYVISFMEKYISNANLENEFERKLAISMKDFINEIDKLNVLNPLLMSNDKNRKLSLFNNNINKKEEIFSDIYSVNYKASLAYLAQAQRHRTLNYQMDINGDLGYFIPPIIEDDKILKNEYLRDIYSISNLIPIGKLVNINENGTYDDFILKTKERLCTHAQLEIALKTREILLKYKDELERSGHYLKDDIKKYTKGARCTSGDYICTDKCNFKEGINFTRKI